MWKLKLVPSLVSDDGARERDEQKFLPCIYFDTGLYIAKEDPVWGFPRIHASLNDIGGSLRFADWLDIGAGLGWITFDSGKDTHSKFTVTPIRIVARPMLLFYRPALLQRSGDTSERSASLTRRLS
jgi:hypothetical protein